MLIGWPLDAHLFLFISKFSATAVVRSGTHLLFLSRKWQSQAFHPRSHHRPDFRFRATQIVAGCLPWRCRAQGDATDAALIIDESAFVKQDKMSVGASRQYLGRLGKVPRGQVAVFGVLAKGLYATAIDTRLYLPTEWTDDPQRCDKAGIPESEQVFKTKNELALEIVE